MLETYDLSYSYRWRRSKEVFSELNWSLRPEGTTMLLGPNGAGKSTLLKLLAGHLAPTHGNVRLDNRPSSKRVLWRKVSWMPQDVQPARGMRALEQVEYAGWLAGRSSREARHAARDAMDQVGLTDQMSERAQNLSGGQLRRLGLAQAMLQRGTTLLLDEPTSGLDPAQSMRFRSILRGLDYPGGILVSTHQANDLAANVDFVVVVAKGEVRFDGTIDSFRNLAPAPDQADAMSAAYAECAGIEP